MKSQRRNLLSRAIVGQVDAVHTVDPFLWNQHIFNTDIELAIARIVAKRHRHFILFGIRHHGDLENVVIASSAIEIETAERKDHARLLLDRERARLATLGAFRDVYLVGPGESPPPGHHESVASW